MKSQQQAEREEQQRIKNLVLKYDLGNDVDQHDGEAHSFLTPVPEIERNLNHTYGLRLGLEKNNPTSHSRSDRSGNQRNGSRAKNYSSAMSTGMLAVQAAAVVSTVEFPDLPF